jgi:hypothetical protein
MNGRKPMMESGEFIHSCTIITTTPNELMQPIHDRIPSILKPDDEHVCLSSDVTDPIFLHSIALEHSRGLFGHKCKRPHIGSPSNKFYQRNWSSFIGNSKLSKFGSCIPFLRSIGATIVEKLLNIMTNCFNY